MKRKSTILFILIFLSVISIGNLGCQKKGNNNAASEEKNFLSIKGSDTMVHLVSNWAEVFMKSKPGVEVSVTGGGSGTGIAAILGKTADICASSRLIKNKEKELATRKKIKLQEFIVAKDGIAVVVNQANPLNSLTMEQLEKLYTGVFTSWKEVGGPDEKVLLLSRDSSSGTFVFFQKQVLNKQDYSRNARLMSSTASIIQSVSSDKWAIGYVGLGYTQNSGNKFKVVKIKNEKTGQTVAPSLETVKNNSYPIARPLLLYVNSSHSQVIKNFLDFTLSTKGQEIVKETGYVPR